MKSFKIVAVAILVITFISCADKKERQVQYMSDTDMYTPVSYETYGETADGEMSARKPVDGTIARGQVPYDYPDTQEGLMAAKDSLKSPLESAVANRFNCSCF